MLRDTMVMLFFLAAGYVLASSFGLDVHVAASSSLSPLKIFANNIAVAILSVLGTCFLAYFIFFVNSLFLGMNIYFPLNVYSFSEMMRLLSFHAPVEVFCWLLTLQISVQFTKFLFVQKDIFPRRKTVLLTSICFFLAAVIESLISRG
ncbi:stage II sporulation protein M [Bacillus swezeyi]|uniref:stage II sporulation protein M n=1 Tax=Bacillus swezeyi TaxID=1925020 RepID=UPI0039C5C482